MISSFKTPDYLMKLSYTNVERILREYHQICVRILNQPIKELFVVFLIKRLKPKEGNDRYLTTVL